MNNSKCSRCGAGYDSLQTFPKIGGYGKEVNEEYMRRRRSGTYDLCDHCLTRTVLIDRDRAAAAQQAEEPASE